LAQLVGKEREMMDDLITLSEADLEDLAILEELGY
jgi:hypothetical protein